MKIFKSLLVLTLVTACYAGPTPDEANTGAKEALNEVGLDECEVIDCSTTNATTHTRKCVTVCRDAILFVICNNGHCFIKNLSKNSSLFEDGKTDSEQD